MDGESSKSKEFVERLANCDTEIESSVSKGGTFCSFLIRNDKKTTAFYFLSDGITHVSFPRFKKRYSFVILNPADMNGVLDVTKVCDGIMVVVPLEELSTVGDSDFQSFSQNHLTKWPLSECRAFAFCHCVSRVALTSHFSNRGRARDPPQKNK